MIWRVMGGDGPAGILTLAFIILSAGAFSIGAHQLGLRQWKIDWRYLSGAYALSVLTILVIARGMIVLFSGG